jgi:hypothetical protein
MKPILESILFAIAALSPVAIMGFAALLIYEQKDGWGWYLLAAVLIAGSMKLRFDGFSS